MRQRLAVGCLDFRGYPALRSQMNLGRLVSPHVRGAGQGYQYIAECLRWPTPFTNPPRPAKVAPNVKNLVVNALYDPSTAYAWAQLMLTEIRGSVLLTRVGEGHPSYFRPGPTRDAIDEYLITGKTPPPGAVIRQ
ncbi:alpha/beta hydrolase [Streptomyces yerevanensis]|uniref:alpha/beta hydrolase n=1 Tax=Streptomyces yerevanensis TaxID=66378 RepID=UPI000524BB39|nr:alpha/beta hydrolase [Streptomyces yerevanensis]